jgi:hypothetical protein
VTCLARHPRTEPTNDLATGSARGNAVTQQVCVKRRIVFIEAVPSLASSIARTRGLSSGTVVQSDPGTVCQSGRVIAPRVLVKLVLSSRLVSRVPYAYAAVAHDVSRLVFTAGACPLR